MIMTKIGKVVLIASAIMGLCNSFINAQSKKLTAEVSVFSGFNTLPENKTAKQKTKVAVQKQFQGWAATCDKLNGMFTDIYGAPVAFDGSTVAEKAQSCITKNLGSLGVSGNDWVVVSNVNAPKATYVNFKQVINGHDVVFSKLSFRFTKDNELARIQMKNYGKPNQDLVPKIAAKQVGSLAVKDIKNITITHSDISNTWSWFPLPKANGYELHPAWHFTINGNVPGSVPLKLTGYVDAITGNILSRTNEVKETAFDVTVKGVVYKNGTLNPTSLEALPDLQIVTGLDTIYTDTSGHATDPLTLLPYTATIPLLGKWSTVIDSTTGLNPAFVDAVSTSGSLFTYPVIAPSSDRHVNAYYHVNRVHNFMKKYFPTFTGMDFSLPTKVDEVGGTCNAFYDGTSINFYAAGGGCYSFADYGDVIYHEYGHGISDHFYTNITGSTINNGSLNEALSDIWALSITRSPILAANAFTGFGGFIRRYDNTPQVYPIDLNTTFFADVHQNGQIIAGTWWDVGQNIGSVDSMTKLFTDVYYDAPDGPTGTEGAIYQTILIDALMADDNDANLFNGTPHYSQIVAAFARHGIYMEGDATLTHTELANQPVGMPIQVQASLSVSRPEYFHDLTLFYHINDTGTWHSVVMTDSALNFKGIIPAQNVGTVVAYYFVIHDSIGVPNAYFPITCNPNNPAFESSIPYQFGVDLVATGISNNFEGSTTGWGISGNTGDDATAGVWQQGIPVPSFFLTAWPATDHTTGAGQCLVTGNGTTGFVGQGVSNGTSTVITPVFDLSNFHVPVISYYRWFSNDQGQNFKNDPWIVMIQDSVAGTWQTVERTYQSDVNWRHRMFQVHSYLPGAKHVSVKFFASDSVLTNWSGNGQSTTVGGLDDFMIYDRDSSASVANVVIPKAHIAPNPANNTLSVSFTDNSVNGSISLCDMFGNKTTEIAMNESTRSYTLTTANIPQGIYFLIIRSEKFIQSEKISILH